MQNLLADLNRRHVFRVAIGYVAIAWVIAQVAEFAFDTFNAPDWVLQSLVIVLLLGLPVAIFLAWAYEITPDGVKRDEDVDQGAETIVATKPGKRRPIAVGVAAVVAAAVAWFAYDYRQSGIAAEAAMAELVVARELAAEDRFGEAYAALQRLLPVIGDSEEFNTLLNDITVEIDPRIANDDARISFRPYNVPDAEWVAVATRGGEKPRAPRGGLLLRIEKPGYDTREIAVANPGAMFRNSLPQDDERVGFPIPDIELYEVDEVPDDMVRIPSTDMPIYVTGFTVDTLGDQRYRISSFDIGRKEVTNREFKAFVDDDGYRNPAYWNGIRTVDGSEIDEATIASFTDTTGRPGPSYWELGSYPSGSADLPVGGISLYEAKAYARYRGMSLPTIHHWARAAFAPMEGIDQIAPYVAHDSNFDRSGPVAANTEIGIGPWGTINMAGNAREWVWNTSGELGVALGGGWNNYDDIFQDVYTIDPLDRAPENGLRLMHTLGEPVDSTLLDPVVLNHEALTVQREPVSDETFEAMRFQYTHVNRAPDNVTINVVDENDTWVAEEVVLEYPGDATLTVFVVSPANPVESLQPIIYMPHAGGVQNIPNRQLLEQMSIMNYVVQAGRAIVIPVYAGTAQRYVERPDDEAAAADFDRRIALARYADIANTIDYLQSREDVDGDAIGFLGLHVGDVPGDRASRKGVSAYVRGNTLLVVQPPDD
jgi:hypothetical protein